MSECESVFLPYLLGMQCACAVLYRHLCPVWLYHISPNYLKKRERFSKEKNCWTQNVCFDFLYKVCLKMFSFSEEFSSILSWMYRGLHKTWIFSTYFREAPKYQISWKSVRCESHCSMRTDGQTDGRTDGRTDGQTDMKQLTVFLRNFANVSKERLRKISYWFAIYRFISSDFTFVV